MKLLRQYIKQLLKESNQYGWEVASKKTMMLDKPGMEKKYKDKIEKYLKSLGLMENEIIKENKDKLEKYRSMIKKKFADKEEFSQANLSGWGGKSGAWIVNYIDTNSRTRLDLNKVRTMVYGEGDWFFLLPIEIANLDHQEVIPSGAEDLNKPIVIGNNGIVLDGRHRVAMAKDEGKSHLQAWIPASVFYDQIMN